MRRRTNSFGIRRNVFKSDLPFKKYFLTFEGEKTEQLYFEKIDNIKDELIKKESVEFIYLERNYLHRRWSHPKKIFEIVQPIMKNLINSKSEISNLITSIVDYCFINSNKINTKDDCSELVEYLEQFFYNDRNYEKNGLLKYDIKLIEELVIKLNIFLNEEIFQNQLEPFIKLQFGTYDPELDEVCLIVDRDKNSFSKEQFEELKKNCRLNNFKLYLTNPCFEFWLLLHFDEVIEVDRIKLFENKKSKYKNNEGIFEEITYAEVFLRSIIPEYRKNDINFNLTKENLQLAIYNSKKFETDINKLKDSVGSNLGMLFEELINRKNS